MKTTIKQMYISILEDYEAKKNSLLKAYFADLAKAKKSGLQKLEVIIDKGAQLSAEKGLDSL
mgnify:CR=1 FL=1